MEPLSPGDPGSGGDDSFSRRIVAVLLADVTGYSSLMGKDDEGTARAVEQLQVFVRDIVREGMGNAEHVAGDAIFATFGSVTAAVDAAIEIQKRVQAETFAGMHLKLRIGVHFGDVLLRQGGAHGDAINVAARLQSLARPGTICVSDGVYRQVRYRLDEKVVDLGRHHLKNISDPVHAYLIEPGVPGSRRSVPRRLRTVLAVSAAGVLVLGGVGWLYGRHWLSGERTSTEATSPQGSVSPEPDQAKAPLVTLGVMSFKQLGNEPEDAWMLEALRDGLNTQLSGLSRVKVYSKEFLDFLVTRKGLSEIEVANRLHITKMLTGSFLAVGGTVKINTHVVDVASGVIEASYTTSGPENRFLDLQNDVTMAVVSRLNLPVTAQEREAMLARRETDAEALRLLLESEGAGRQPRGTPSASRTMEPDAMSRSTYFSWWPAAAAAAESPGDEAQIRTLLEKYRRAMESGRVERLASVYTDLSPDQRDAQERYFASVRDLEVRLGEIDIAVVGDEAVVSYTRTDHFVDRRTGRPMKIAVRLTKTLLRRGGEWKLKPGE